MGEPFRAVFLFVPICREADANANTKSFENEGLGEQLVQSMPGSERIVRRRNDL
jgi:hypothetical protein